MLKINGLLSVSYAEEGNIGFKQGQEILIHYDGMRLASYPGQIVKVGKIEIVKEKSDISIPVDALRYYYSSRNNVSVTITKLTKTGMSFTITDNNELPYDYSNIYQINKKNKQAEVNIEESNISQPATLNAIYPYTGSGQVLWAEAPRISDILIESTVISSANSNKNVIEKTYDWTGVYGELEERRI